MSCHAWLVGGLVTLAGDLAQGLPPPPPIPPQPATRSGAEILGRPGIRTRYVDPSGPAPSAGSKTLPAVGPPARPLTVPVNERVDFTPTMEEGPFQQPTLRGLFRWDLQQPSSR
ncbi:MULTISPECIES: hypothetical protein [unclassified Cyanobium]|uniref:hypothetical protein n=1 Tax=unclassified Cyanobium TaxID=2627006 RepID=UPI0020CE4904|nr:MULTISPECIES: hypothetical protein [unclassified Cyanobium]MCP9859599.1 hypothetical protein [Cyanobium sp. Cruz-8H5]MCP9867973.1 hypothetical protein [Cyanobium sp. Cruz-8D1]